MVSGRIWSTFLAACLSLSVLPAQAANHPEREWLVLETPNFLVHHYQGEGKTARRIAKSAEDALPKLSADFGITPKKKIPIIIDRDAFFNGTAEPLKDRVTLDPVLATSSVIGTDRFVAHELAHVISFLALDKDSVLSKLNNLSSFPTWFMEGIAQYAGEYWYSSNDRMLRLHALSDTMLSNSERKNFPLLGGVAGAAGYNEGYALTKFIFDTHGREKIKELFQLVREGKEPSFERALAAVTGKPYATILADWRKATEETYRDQTEGMAAHLLDSTPLIAPSNRDINMGAKISPDGKRLAFLTSRDQDAYMMLRGHVMGFLSLAVANPDGSGIQDIPASKGRIQSFDWAPDGQRLVFSAVTVEAGTPTFALYLYDLKTRKAEQLTKGSVARDPAWRPNSEQIAYTSTHDGEMTLHLYDLKLKTSLDVPSSSLGERMAQHLSWSSDGSELVASIYRVGEGGKIGMISPTTGDVRMLTSGKAEDTDSHPVSSPDGTAILFTSNRDGMENLYRLGLAPKRLTQLSQVYAGVERPAYTPDGQLLYTAYRSLGSEIRKAPVASAGIRVAMSAPKPADPLPSSEPASDKVASLGGGAPASGLPVIERGALASGSVAAGSLALGTSVSGSLASEPWKLRSYEPEMTNDVILPQMTTDERGQQLGVLSVFSDILNKQSLGLDVRYGIMSQRFSYSMQYLNRMQDFTWGAMLYDAPTVSMATTVNPNDLYGSMYWAQERGASLMAMNQFGSQRLSLGFNLGHLSALSDPSGGQALGVRQGKNFTLGVGWMDSQITSTSDMDINPSAGYTLAASYLASHRVWGSDFTYQQVALGGSNFVPVIPQWRHNLAFHWRASLNRGEATTLMLGGVTGGGVITPLRGYNVGSFTGDRLAYAGLEYTAPLQSNLDLQLGPIYLNKIYATTFVEAGDAWNSKQGPMKPSATAGGELRLRTSFMGRQLVIFRFGLAQRLSPDGDLKFYMAF